MIIVVANNNGNPREAKEYFNLEFDGGYYSKLEKGNPFFHSSPINPDYLKKELKELESLFK